MNTPVISEPNGLLLNLIRPAIAVSGGIVQVLINKTNTAPPAIDASRMQRHGFPPRRGDRRDSLEDEPCNRVQFVRTVVLFQRSVKLEPGLIQVAFH